MAGRVAGPCQRTATYEPSRKDAFHLGCESRHRPRERLRAARDGANVAIAAKTTEAHPKLPGTIFSAAAEIEAAGGTALALQCDIRFEEQVVAAVEAAAARFGGIDMFVNNASAISLTGTLATDMKRYDLMQQINARATFLCSRAAIPFLKKAENPHVLTLSPPLDMQAKWFAPHVAYTTAKFGMSLCTSDGGRVSQGRYRVQFAVPLTTIDTAAIRNLLGGEAVARVSRSPEIIAEAAYRILTKPSRAAPVNFSSMKRSWFRRRDRFAAYAAGDVDGPYAADFFVPDDAFCRERHADLARVGAAHRSASYQSDPSPTATYRIGRWE